MTSPSLASRQKLPFPQIPYVPLLDANRVSRE